MKYVPFSIFKILFPHDPTLFHFMKKLILLLVFAVVFSAQAQKSDLTTLFRNEEPLEIKLKFSVKEVKKITVDTIYTASVMHFKTGDKWDSIPVEIRARGNFRRANCYFPPLRVKIKKDAAKGTVFEGNRSLKLVLPCKSAKDGNLVLREYVCYKMYEPVTKYIFHTRRVNIDFTDVSTKKMQHVPVVGFFIEDDDLVAKRFNAKVIETQMSPMRLQDSASLRHDFFQFLIANTDWSTAFMHNAKVIQMNDAKNTYVPLTYDFDMSGVVNAPYAQVNETLGIASVTERLYRGFCRQPQLMEAIRQEYLSNEGKIVGALKGHESLFEPKEFNGMHAFVKDFFEILRSNDRFKTNVLEKCRTK